jgi:hypothetical protein
VSRQLAAAAAKPSRNGESATKPVGTPELRHEEWHLQRQQCRYPQNERCQPNRICRSAAQWPTARQRGGAAVRHGAACAATQRRALCQVAQAARAAVTARAAAATAAAAAHVQTLRVGEPVGERRIGADGRDAMVVVVRQHGPLPAASHTARSPHTIHGRDHAMGSHPGTGRLCNLRRQGEPKGRLACAWGRCGPHPS